MRLLLIFALAVSTYLLYGAWKGYTAYSTFIKFTHSGVLKNAFENYNITPGTALEFGSGDGHGVQFLLERGYKVIAVDNDASLLKALTEKKAILPYKNNLTTIHSNFKDLDWASLPKIDLFFAQFAFEHADPDYFHRIWNAMVTQLKPGGYFIGTLMAHSANNTFYKNENINIDDLFTEFEIEYWEDYTVGFTGQSNKNNSAKTAVPNQEYISYTIVAKKKTS